MTRFATGAALVASMLALAGCGAGAERAARAANAAPRCTRAQLASWQRLADRIGARVYCPAWMPDPLDGVIGSRWNNIDSVSPDRSYLESWV